MKLLEFLEQLNEGKSEYSQMMPPDLGKIPVYSGGETLDQLFAQEISWAQTTLKKKDRIVWFLRFAKREMIARAMSNLKTQDPQYAIAQQHYGTILKKLGGANAVLSQPSTNNIKNTLEHFYSLSIPQIDSIVLNTQAPSDLFETMAELEQQWKRKQKETIANHQVSDGTTVLIKFLNGMQWVNLNQNYCRIEGNAMGHCGNTGSPKTTDTVLSLREPVKGGWRPCLTFILDTETGMLGEMKGRANEKPAPKYHPYIIKLLESNIVKGIRGGGYLAQNNFSMSDLPKSEQERLLTIKPQLMNWFELYKIQGYTALVKSRLQTHLPRSIVLPEASDQRVSIESYDDLGNFINEFQTDLPNASYCYDLTNGDQQLDFDVDYAQVKDFYESLPDDVRESIDQYTKEQHADEQEPSVLQTLKSNYDDLYDTLRSAVYQGLQSGTLSEISSTMINHFENHVFRDTFELEMQDPSQGISFSNLRLTISLDDLCYAVSNAQQQYDDEDTTHSPEIKDQLDFDRKLHDIPDSAINSNEFDRDAAYEYLYENRPSGVHFLPLKFWSIK